MSQPGRFSCSFQGCQRTFSRQEHLQRHVLNHAEIDFTCERCRTVFKRPDLLGMLNVDDIYLLADFYQDRHMARHRQKDLEGGKLMTRKRLYKDDEGNVISKRPARERRTTTRANSANSQDTFALPLSPPGSSSDLTLSPSRIVEPDETIGQHAPEESTWYSRPPQETQQSHVTGLEPFFDEYLPWSNTASSAIDQSVVNGPFDDIFMPDTASSFNMPYTTANNYNWL